MAIVPLSAPPEILTQVSAFLVREARLIDERRFGDWLDLFTADAAYWLPIQPGQKSPLDSISLIYDDRMLLEMRVKRMTEPSFHAQTPPSRTIHIVANVECEPGGSGEILARSKQIIGEYRRNKQRIYLASVVHRLAPMNGSFRIALKRVELLDCDAELDGLAILF